MDMAELCSSLTHASATPVRIYSTGTVRATRGYRELLCKAFFRDTASREACLVPDAMVCAQTPQCSWHVNKASFISAIRRASLWVPATSISYISRVVSSHLQPLTLRLFRSGIAKTEMPLEAFFFAESPRPVSPPKPKADTAGCSTMGPAGLPAHPTAPSHPTESSPRLAAQPQKPNFGAETTPGGPPHPAWP